MVSYFSLEMTRDNDCVCAVCLLKMLMSWQDALWSACRVCMQESGQPDLCW